MEQGGALPRLGADSCDMRETQDRYETHQEYESAVAHVSGYRHRTIDREGGRCTNKTAPLLYILCQQHERELGCLRGRILQKAGARGRAHSYSLDLACNSGAARGRD